MSLEHLQFLTPFLQLYVFVLAGFVGYIVITRVPALLHTPLMSATNAISGISLVGSLVAAGGSHGTVSTVLGLIAERPGTRAPDLAASLGRETAPFKADVRKLKELGLTESLLVGYRLSPRGRAYLSARAR